MSTCSRLELQTLGSQPVMLKNLPDHFCILKYIPQEIGIGIGVELILESGKPKGLNDGTESTSRWFQPAVGSLEWRIYICM